MQGPLQAALPGPDPAQFSFLQSQYISNIVAFNKPSPS
jgi:hypothetical protein